MKKEQFYYDSADGLTKIHAISWIPDETPTAILQVAHGMVEFIDRYDEFGTYLADHGILLTGNDHLGHGFSVTDESKLGYFAKKDGNAKVLKDMDQLHKMTAEKYPGVPYFVLGHSMGSFLIRQYIVEYKDGLQGVIIMGTGFMPAAAMKAGKALCKIQALFKGWEYRSSTVNNMAFASNNKKFGAPDGREWLSRNPDNVAKYNAEPLDNFMFTLNGYYNMFYSMGRLTEKDYIAKMDRKLPVLITSGAEDPVGNYGDGPSKLFEQFKGLGMEDVELKLYPDDRHEILNELDRDQVYADILAWLKSKF